MTGPSHTNTVVPFFSLITSFLSFLDAVKIKTIKQAHLLAAAPGAVGWVWSDFDAVQILFHELEKNALCHFPPNRNIE